MIILKNNFWILLKAHHNLELLICIQYSISNIYRHLSKINYNDKHQKCDHTIYYKMFFHSSNYDYS